VSLWKDFYNKNKKTLKNYLRHIPFMSIALFQEELENSCKKKRKKLQITINDNRSTMLSVRWGPDCTKVSLHRMFLHAPQNIMQSLACYIRQEDKIIHPKVKAFIENGLQRLDYSDVLNKQKLYQNGNVYNLKHIYDELNAEYFGNKLQLKITWFGQFNRRNRTRVTFGLYHDPLKLIKINRMLDSPNFPEYIISYVVYHEMVHNVCPAYVDERGINRVHTKEFKEMEANFKHFALAEKWIAENQQNFFAIR
jgi:predicted metal-dependent hydrolase